MNLRRFLCLFNRHRPNRNRTKWNGHFYTSKCEACGQPVYRLGKQKWRKDNQEAPGKV
ncbi:hypothetical protein [Novosphingobium umbonatum]|uniref:hypothetical protein n=1 Tax=Novosphingobium umbonatum TaxID=1908524 RepID=UPI0013E2DAAD|nr:hypothetical protein [Novosphingobium umbonatum]